MTTVAWDGETLAADTRITGYGGMDSAVKLLRLPDGSIAGCAGDLTACRVALKWLTEGADPLLRPKIVGELALLVVLANGHLYYIDEPLVPLRYHRKFQAIGSGLEYATGAMAMGADAKEAVRVAIKFDSDSGGRIHTMKPKLVAGKRPLRLKV